MSMRELFNKHPQLAGGVAVCLLAAGVVVARLASPAAQRPGAKPMAFFSDDDGKTYFADVEKPSGFNHNGKPAYLANVFVRGSGPPFVGFMRRNAPVPAVIIPEQATTPGQMAKPGAELAKALAKDAAPVKFMSGAPAGMIPAGTVQDEVKEPGDTAWHLITGPSGAAIMAKYGPAAQSSGTIEAVTPD